MIVTMAPERIAGFEAPSVFLAGSIEMGEAEEWQAKVIETLEDMDIHVMNPRRDDWNPEWTADDPFFKEQVEWELYYLALTHVVFMYFDPNTKSPVSLLELGLHVGSRLIVCCPDGFWRKGNVDIVCAKEKVHVYTNLEVAIAGLRGRMERY